MEISDIGIYDTDPSGPYYIWGICDDVSQIPIDYDEFEYGGVYLHKDGVWRRSTLNKETGEYSGYFRTKEEAEQALHNYQVKFKGVL